MFQFTHPFSREFTQRIKYIIHYHFWVPGMLLVIIGLLLWITIGSLMNAVWRSE